MFRQKVHWVLCRINKNKSTLRYIAKHEGQGANHKIFQREKDYLQRIDNSFFHQQYVLEDYLQNC